MLEDVISHEGTAVWQLLCAHPPQMAALRLPVSVYTACWGIANVW